MHDYMHDYVLTRSNRKTTAIYVRNGIVEVRAPMRMRKGVIDVIVALKKDWIAGKLAESQEQMARRSNFSLTYGDLVTYRGKQYPIAEIYDGSHGFDGKCFVMPPDLTPEQVKSYCVRVFRMLAERDLTARTLDYAAVMGVKPSSIRINNAKARWGSCSRDGRINYAWRLIMADDEVIDYILIHELAHMIELNHSTRFWALVEDNIPDYKVRQKRLDELQRRLGGENWD